MMGFAALYPSYGNGSRALTLSPLQRPCCVALEQDRAGRSSDGRAAFRLQRDLEQLILHGFRQRLQVELQRARLTGDADQFRAGGAIPQGPNLQRAAGGNLDRSKRYQL